MDPLDTSSLLNFLRQEEGRAVDTGLDEQRAAALRFYNGEKFGNEEEGRSQVVTRDVAEVIDQQVVSVLGTVLAGGKVVEFQTEEVEGEPDENGKPTRVDYGQEATEAVAYQFMRKQNGYRVLHDCLKAGLLEKSGIVKTVVEVQTELRSMDVLGTDISDDMRFNGVPIENADGLDEGWVPGTPSTTWRIEVRVPSSVVFRDLAVPNEEFGVSADAQNLDDAAYLVHKTSKSLSDLARMGFDTKPLLDGWSDIPSDSIVGQARDRQRTNRQQTEQRTGVNRQVYLREEYPLWDLNGDGIAERLCVHRVGNLILTMQSGVPAVREVEEQPFSLWSPFPMSHRLVGQSSADKTMDIQAIRSTLLRQGLDSLYLSNAPRMGVSVDGMTDDTIDDLLTVRPGALVRFKGNLAPTPIQMSDTSPQAFQAMEMMTTEREARTGVTRHNQGLNPDTLNKTATGMAMLQSQGDQVQLYIARNFAELLVAPMFAKRYRLMKRYGQPFRMRIDGKYVDIDPTRWPDEIDVQINVGLGTGSKDQRLQHRMALLQLQEQVIAGGMRIVGEKQVFNAIKGAIEDSGLGSASDYVLDPDMLGEAPEKQDPEAVKAQVEGQTQQAKDAQAHQQVMSKLQLQQEEQQASAALKAQQNDQDLTAKREKAALDSELARARAAEEADLAERRMQFEQALALERFNFEMELGRKRADAEEKASTPSYRPGGDLAE
jgi:hypothetical protein